MALQAVQERLKERGILVATCYEPREMDALRDLTLPIWVRCGHTLCMRVDHRADLPLALAKAEGIVPEGPVFLQEAVPGETLYVVAARQNTSLHPVECIRVDIRKRAFRMAHTLSLPARLDNNQRTAITDLCHSLGKVLPPDVNRVELEIVLTDAGPVVVDLALEGSLESMLGVLMEVAHGPNWWEGNSVSATPAVLGWLKSRTGVVSAIEGVDEARQLPGIRQVQINVKPGDTLRHVVVKGDRNRIGHVLASGSSAAEVIEQARTCIHIVTSRTLG
jgi:hypothetical protein